MSNIGATSLADYLKVVSPFISERLISLENCARISTVAQFLPSEITTFFGFESRLGVLEAAADFLICADAAETGRQVLAGNIPNVLQQHPVWSNIHNFSTHWNTVTAPLYEKVRNIWLEFDIDGAPNLPVPSCFFGPEPILSGELDSYRWVSDALKLLTGRTLSSSVEQQLFNCFKLLPEQAYVFQIGVMLARKTDAVRICIRNISPEQILDYLSQINWSGSLAELQKILTKLSSLVDRIDLDLDVGEGIFPKIGLECYLIRQPKFEPRWQLFLDHLVATGLCIPQKREALLAYPGCIRESSCRELFPSHLTRLSSFLGSQYERVFFRGLHHIKVVYQQSQILEAKAYLSVSHRLLSPQFVSQWRELQNASV